MAHWNWTDAKCLATGDDDQSRLRAAHLSLGGERDTTAQTTFYQTVLPVRTCCYQIVQGAVDSRRSSCAPVRPVRRFLLSRSATEFSDLQAFRLQGFRLQSSSASIAAFASTHDQQAGTPTGTEYIRVQAPEGQDASIFRGATTERIDSRPAMGLAYLEVPPIFCSHEHERGAHGRMPGVPLFLALRSLNPR